jgi:hypothetical protein
VSTHVDPFAPADSDRHPANHGHVQEADPVESTPQAEQRGGTVEFPVVLGTGTVESLKRPARDATRDRWVAYAKLLDPDLTDEDLKPITVAGMREMTALQDGTAEADA